MLKKSDLTQCITPCMCNELNCNEHYSHELERCDGYEVATVKNNNNNLCDLYF